MNTKLICKTLIATLAAVTLVGLSGCNKIASSLDEKFEERQEAQKIFDHLNSQCPKKINEYTTLTRVSYGLGQVEYRYEVSESGRTKVILPNKWLVKGEILEETKGTSAGRIIQSLDMVTKHVFKDADGKQMLSFDMTAKDIRNFKGQEENELLVKVAGLATDETAADLKAELANLKHRPSLERAKIWFQELDDQCPKKISDNITLDWVKFTGKNRVEYRYIVLRDGLQELDFDHKKMQVLKNAREMRGTRLGDAVMALDLSVKHSYKSPQDTQVMAFFVTRTELIEAGKTDEQPALGPVTPGYTEPSETIETTTATESPDSGEAPESEDSVTEEPAVQAPPKPKTNPFFSS